MFIGLAPAPLFLAAVSSWAPAGSTGAALRVGYARGQPGSPHAVDVWVERDHCPPPPGAASADAWDPAGNATEVVSWLALWPGRELRGRLRQGSSVIVPPELQEMWRIPIVTRNVSDE